MENKYILAMYDIRGKQEFIYRVYRIKAIMGASYMIRDCFEDYLYPAAEEISPEGIFSYKKKGTEQGEFTPEGFHRHLEQGYIGEVVYDGGGNFLVLYRDLETYRNVNRRFYRKLLENTGSLRVLTTCIEGVDFKDYKGDRDRLYERHRIRERQETLQPPVNTLPFVQTDYQTSRPLARIYRGPGGAEKVSFETAKKYEKYKEVMDRKADQYNTLEDIDDKILERTDREAQGTTRLDELITGKGEESLLAVIYIDGNNMGAQVQKCIDGDRSYAASIKALRKFSADIQKHYIDDRIKDVDQMLQDKKRRFVVYAGDEVTFICNARNAYDLARKYLTGLAEDSPAGSLRTSCAGIAVFHSHAPFADAYRVAEECCESGKTMMKKLGLTSASLLDFHYCQGAFGTSLEAIRKAEKSRETVPGPNSQTMEERRIRKATGTETLSRPWFILCGDEKIKEGKTMFRGQFETDETIQKMKEMLNRAGRGNIKNLAVAAKRSAADFIAERERIIAHNQDRQIDFSLGGELSDDRQRWLIGDMALVYDLWFRSRGKE